MPPITITRLISIDTWTKQCNIGTHRARQATGCHHSQQKESSNKRAICRRMIWTKKGLGSQPGPRSTANTKSAACTEWSMKLAKRGAPPEPGGDKRLLEKESNRAAKSKNNTKRKRRAWVRSIPIWKSRRNSTKGRNDENGKILYI